MPAATIGDQRWQLVGYNSAGDPMYGRGAGDGGVRYADDGYESWTKDELSAELESRGLPKSGNKDELIARLQEDDG